MKPGNIKFFQKHLLSTANFVSQGFLPGWTEPPTRGNKASLWEEPWNWSPGDVKQKRKINPSGSIWEQSSCWVQWRDLANGHVMGEQFCEESLTTKAPFSQGLVGLLLRTCFSGACVRWCMVRFRRCDRLYSWPWLEETFLSHALSLPLQPVAIRWTQSMRPFALAPPWLREQRRAALAVALIHLTGPL